MTALLCQSPVFALCDQPQDHHRSALRVAAAAGGWPVLDLHGIGLALRVLMRHRPQLVVVEVTAHPEWSLRLIEVLRERGGRLPVLAIAPTPSEDLEQQIRVAGAAVYLADPHPDAICHAVAAVRECSTAGTGAIAGTTPSGPTAGFTESTSLTGVNPRSRSP